MIANGISVHTDPAALIVGPTGVALSPSGTLFVADTVKSRIARIPDAVFRSQPVNAGAPSATVSAGTPLNGPLGLILTPNGDLLTANGGDNNLVELTREERSPPSATWTRPTCPVVPCSAWPRPRTRARSTSSTTTKTP